MEIGKVLQLVFIKTRLVIPLSSKIRNDQRTDNWIHVTGKEKSKDPQPARLDPSFGFIKGSFENTFIHGLEVL